MRRALGEMTIATRCAVLGISRPCYYSYLKRGMPDVDIALQLQWVNAMLEERAARAKPAPPEPQKRRQDGPRLLVCRACGYGPERSVRTNAAGTWHQINCSHCDRLVLDPDAAAALTRWNAGEQVAKPPGPAPAKPATERQVRMSMAKPTPPQLEIVRFDVTASGHTALVRAWLKGARKKGKTNA